MPAVRATGLGAAKGERRADENEADIKQLRESGKLLAGDARLSLPRGGFGSGNYFAYAPGAIVDYRVSRRLSARVDYEFQVWPSFKGIPTTTTSGTGGLTPNGFSFGVSYAILR
jgi:hypothetical protein